MNTLLLFDDLGNGELLLLLFGLGYPLLAIICLINIIRSTFKDPTNKLIWALVIIFAPFIGSITYLIIGDKSKTNE